MEQISDNTILCMRRGSTVQVVGDVFVIIGFIVPFESTETT